MSHELVSTYSDVMPSSVADKAGDLELVARTKRGDAEAFSELVLRHQQVVYSLSYRFMRDASLAEDMAQEAFLKAFRLPHGFRGDCSFSTWMYRVTCSVCLTELSRRKKRGEVELMPGHAGAATTLPTPESSDMARAVRACVSKLPERYAAIISSYYLHDVSYDEIARLMRIPMGTLKTWMFRARKQLRKIVEQELTTHESD